MYYGLQVKIYEIWFLEIEITLYWRNTYIIRLNCINYNNIFNYK